MFPIYRQALPSPLAGWRGPLPRLLAVLAAAILVFAWVLLALALALALAQGAALAQEAVPAAAMPVAAPDWFWPVLALGLGLLGSAIAWGLHRYLGIKLDQDARDRLHGAMLTGAKMVARRYGLRWAELDAAAPGQVIDYVARSVPGAVKRLDPGPGVLADLALAKLSDVVTARHAGAGSAGGP